MNELDYQIKVQKEVADELNLKEKVERLQEQLKELEGYRRKSQQQLDEANKLLRDECSSLMDVKFYLKKWGVK